MQITVKSGPIEKIESDCIIAGVYENGLMTPSLKQLDRQSKGYFTRFLKNTNSFGKIGQIQLFFEVPNLKTKQILLIGCGKNQALSIRDFRKLIQTSTKALESFAIQSAVSCLADVTIAQKLLPWKIKQIILMAREAQYYFDQYKSEKKSPKNPLTQLILYIEDNKKLTACTTALKQALAIANGVEFTKNLANQPGNICTPTYLANEAKKFAKAYSNIKLTILEESDMKKLGMNALLAVSQGSAQAAKLICLEYRGAAKNRAPIALIGKGITFDTGGLALKPLDGMAGMKYDMCGGATVLGTLKAAAELKLPLNLVGIIASAENMVSGTACKPEDIVTSMSGQTIEIMNPDAEGRLVLCDAMTYCERYQPETVIDVATLTGAAVIAFGYHISAVVANYQPLADALLKAGEDIYDRGWQMPLYEEYQEQLKSPFADMTNTGGRIAGIITSSCFLSRFAKKFNWAHLDVAGTAAITGSGADRHATGRPVPMLMQYLLTKCGKS